MTKAHPPDGVEPIRESLWTLLDKALAEKERLDAEIHALRLALQALEPRKERPEKQPVGRPVGRGEVQLALLDLAAEGPFTVGDGVAATGKTYMVVAHTAGILQKRGALKRLKPGTYALPDEPEGRSREE